MNLSVSRMVLPKMLFAALKVSLLFASLVGAGKPGVGPGEQDWNYVEVRPGAHMFYWLYNALVDDPLSRPLVVWLQGGPGASSMYGNFEEFGVVDLELNERNSSWVKHVNVLFVDSPVGTGWSYVDAPSLLTTTNNEIAIDLVTFTAGFYRQHPEFLHSPLYIFGESYGGKVAPEFALELQKAIQAGNSKAPLKGVVLGDPWTSPIDAALSWAPFLMHTGMVDEKGYERIHTSVDKCKEALEAGELALATRLVSSTIDVIRQVTKNISIYNILSKMPLNQQGKERRDVHSLRMTDPTKSLYNDMVLDEPIAEDENQLEALMNGPVRKVLRDTVPGHVRFESFSTAVYDALWEDFMLPATDIVEELLNKTALNVTVITGHLDLIVDTPGTLNWINRLKWDGADAWKRAPRNPLLVDKVIEGYSKASGNFALYWILRAGHMVPTDNPLAGLKVLQEVTKYY